MQDARIDRHISKFSPRHQRPLLELRKTLHEVMPGAQETIKYAMPCFAVQGKGVVGFTAFKAHWSYFPMSGSVLDAVSGLPSWSGTGKGTLRVPLDKDLPKSIVRKLVSERLRQISQIKNGKRFDFYDDGSLKAEGAMKDGKMHGFWKWWRQDGSLMRTGRFRDGQQTGVWETWDRDGRLVKKTKL